MAVDARVEKLIEKLDVALQTNALAHLAQMFLSDFGFELRIMQQQVGEFRALLHQVDLRHALGFALEVLGGNANQFGEHVPGIVERERLVEVARENIAFERLICHNYSIRARGQRAIKRFDCDYMLAWLTRCE